MKWHISQNNREKHGFTVNMYDSDFMVGAFINAFWHFSILQNQDYNNNT